MRYLVAFLAVLAFALMATNAQAVCPSDDLGTFTDSYLKEHGTQTGYSNPIEPNDCPDIEGTYYYCRTDESTETRTIVYESISNTTFFETLDSDVITDEGCVEMPFSEEVLDTLIQAKVELDGKHDDCGHWNGLRVSYSTLKK